jgi:acyl carrier protein
VTDEQAVRAQLRNWVVLHAKRPVAELSDETRIIDEGILSSLDVVELVLYIESLRGAPIDPDALDPHAFTTVSALYQTFFRAA